MSSTTAQFSYRAEQSDSDSLKWTKYAGREILPLWVAVMDCPAAAPILQAMHERVEHGVYGYSIPTRKLLETICAYFARRWNWSINEDWIVLSPGLGTAIHTVCRLPGLATGGFLTPRPIYPQFVNAPRLAGQIRIDVPFAYTDGVWQLPGASFATAAAASTGADVMMLCNPHNPNGHVFSTVELSELAEAALANDWLICTDDVHADLVLNPAAKYCPIGALDTEIAKRTIHLQSPSKAFNIAGLNFAVVVIPDQQLRARYRQATAGQVVGHLDPISLAAAQAAWSGDCDQWLSNLIEHLRANRDLLAEGIAAIDGLAMTRLDATYLAWIDITELDLSDSEAHFERFGLGVMAGGQFGDDRFIRLNFGTDRATVVETLSRLRTAARAA